MTIKAYQQVLDMVVQDAKSEKTKPRDRVEIMKFLDMELDKLWEQITRAEQTKEANTVVLSGPRQVKAKSRLSATQGRREVLPEAYDTSNE